MSLPILNSASVFSFTFNDCEFGSKMYRLGLPTCMLHILLLGHLQPSRIREPLSHSNRNWPLFLVFPSLLPLLFHFVFCFLLLTSSFFSRKKEIHLAVCWECTDPSSSKGLQKSFSNSSFHIEKIKTNKSQPRITAVYWVGSGMPGHLTARLIFFLPQHCNAAAGQISLGHDRVNNF